MERDCGGDKPGDLGDGSRCGILCTDLSSETDQTMGDRQMSETREITPAEGRCIPKDQRRPNEVDRLLEQVQAIRAVCAHDFKLVEPIKLQVSLVEGVYIGGEGIGGDVAFGLECTKCSMPKFSSVTKCCPRCLGCMSDHGLFSRKRYFGRDRSYFAVRCSSCSNCGLSVVCDEWDQ
jgi:hypothetical protein